VRDEGLAGADAAEVVPVVKVLRRKTVPLRITLSKVRDNSGNGAVRGGKGGW
jgi:hypothetical protein